MGVYTYQNLSNYTLNSKHTHTCTHPPSLLDVSLRTNPDTLFLFPLSAVIFFMKAKINWDADLFPSVPY